jgi:hypothetical protein
MSTEVGAAALEVGPVKPDFWRIWHANKDSLQKNGYSVRKNENGQREVRYIPPQRSGWPPVKPNPIFVPIGMQASLCFTPLDCQTASRSTASP